jgi:Concanavalin A-like lectin/glucanases superfamily
VVVSVGGLLLFGLTPVATSTARFTDSVQSASVFNTKTCNTTHYFSALADPALEPDVHLRLDETAGPNAVDSIGGASWTYHSTSSGDFARDGGMFCELNKGFVLSGTMSGGTRVIESTTGGRGVAFSYVVWLKTTTTSGGRIIGLSDPATTSREQSDRDLWLLDDGRLVTSVAAPSGGSKTIAGSTKVNDGLWHMAVVTYSPADGLRLYVDGALEGSKDHAIARAVGTMRWSLGYDSAAPFAAGLTPTNPCFSGGLDEVSIWNRVITQSEILVLLDAARRV